MMFTTRAVQTCVRMLVCPADADLTRVVLHRSAHVTFILPWDAAKGLAQATHAPQARGSGQGKSCRRSCKSLAATAKTDLPILKNPK